MPRKRVNVTVSQPLSICRSIFSAQGVQGDIDEHHTIPSRISSAVMSLAQGGLIGCRRETIKFQRHDDQQPWPTTDSGGTEPIKQLSETNR